MLSSREEQLDLLAKVLAAGEEEAGEEVLPGAPRAALRGAGGANAVRRATGSLAALSGAGGLTYLEFQQQQQQRQRHEQQRQSTRTRMTTKPCQSLPREKPAPTLLSCTKEKPRHPNISRKTPSWVPWKQQENLWMTTLCVRP